MICPQCKGSNIKVGIRASDRYGDGLWYDHYLCIPCNIVLWESKELHFSELGYCGSPVQHWVSKEDINEQA